MLFGSRRFCAAALLLLLSSAVRAGQTNSAAPLAELSSPSLAFDSQSFLGSPISVDSPAPAIQRTIEQRWSNEYEPFDLQAFSSKSVPHSPTTSDPDEMVKQPRVKDDLIVPLPAIGAGWMLLMAGALCKIGSRVVRPN